MRKGNWIIMLPVLAMASMLSPACVMFPGFVPGPRILNSCELLRLDVDGQLGMIIGWNPDEHSDAEYDQAWEQYDTYAHDWVNAGCVA